jgi:hypothetical protein
MVNKATGAKYSFATESPSEKRRWVDNLQAEILRVSNSSWRDAYDQDFQLHDNITEGKREGHDEPTLGVKRASSSSPNILATPSASSSSSSSSSPSTPTSSGGSSRRGSDEVEVNTFATIQRLLGDPYSLLSYTKTMASCTSVMVNQLNAKAMLAEDLDRRENLWSAAKVIADNTVGGFVPHPFCSFFLIFIFF